MENEPLIKGGQGRNLDNRDAWLLWWLTLACFLIFCCAGCGFDRRADQPEGDLLPAPKRATPQDHVERQYFGGEEDQERLTPDEMEKFLKLNTF